MKKILFSILLCYAPIALIAGCGGGGGGNGGPSSPTPTQTPINSNTVLVQLRDDQSNPVDGIVTLGGKIQATISGNTTFTGVNTGNQSVSAEVNGVTTSKNFTVNTGANIVRVVIGSSVTPTPTTTVPPPPI